MTDHTKTPSFFFLFLFLPQLLRDGGIVYLKSPPACPWEPWSFFTSLKRLILLLMFYFILSLQPTYSLFWA